MPCRALGADDFELGFVLAQSAWGRGYAQEIGHGQLRFGFERLGCRRLLAQVAPANAGSIRALERLGMRWHATVESEERGPRHVYVAEHPSGSVRASLPPGS